MVGKQGGNELFGDLEFLNTESTIITTVLKARTIILGPWHCPNHPLAANKECYLLILLVSDCQSFYKPVTSNQVTSQEIDVALLEGIIRKLYNMCCA